MAYMLDLMGSYIVGAIVLLMIVGLDIYIPTSASEVVFNNMVQGNIGTAAEIINYDFYKIGYRTTGNSIVLADSDRIKFDTDISDDGNIDTVYYYPGSTSQLTSTPNPNDKPLYRQLNGDTPLSSIAITEFKLTYYDSLGAQLSYGSLNSQVQRNRIRTIKVYLRVESTEPVGKIYQAAEWDEKITPKNL